MAGGIDWFRWHHGTVTDQKFPLVARRAGASVAEVIAVWACLLERASMNEQERGWLGNKPDFEAMDCALGIADGKALAVFEALQQRDLIDENRHITAWPARQPKREREDDGAADRKRAQREREAAERASAASLVTPSNPLHEQVTPCHATSRQETPRVEESRGEVKPSAPTGACPQASLDDPQTGEQVIPQDPGAYELPDCPHQELVALYHEALPTLPRCEILNDTRRGYVRQRWREVCSPLKLTKADGMDWWRGYFGQVAQSTFLTGRGPPDRNTGRVWCADFEWLMRPTNFAKVVEGKYVDGARR